MEQSSGAQKGPKSTKTSFGRVGKHDIRITGDGFVNDQTQDKEDEIQEYRSGDKVFAWSIIIVIALFIILCLSSCKKEDLPEFCKCHQEHEKTLDGGANWYPYPSANTEPKDGFCDQASDQYYYVTTDQRFKVVCQ